MDNIPPEQLAILAKEDQGPLMKSIVIAFTIIALVSVLLRLGTRFKYQAVGWEDHTIVVSMVQCISVAVMDAFADNHV